MHKGNQDALPSQKKDLPSRQPAGGLPETIELNSQTASLVRQTPEENSKRPSDGPFPEIPGYRVEGVIGRGGMGVVYKARQLSLKRVVALKMLRHIAEAGPQELTRFQAEAQAIARLQHPNIVQVFEVGNSDRYPFLALEFVEGQSLAQQLAGQPMSPHRAAFLVEALARAMQLAHSRNVVHRDLKPGNVLVGNDGVPKIADFGLAKQLDDDSGQTRTGVILGTPSYMAPEQACGQAHAVGPAADVYALGAILYECLTGRPPFKGETVVDTLDQVRCQEPVAPKRLQPRMPRDLETICLKCLRKEPERRYSSAEALANDLRRFLEGRVISARPAGAIEQISRWARRNPGMAALVALTVLSLVAAAIVSLLFAHEANEKASAYRIQKESADDNARKYEQKATYAKKLAEDERKANDLAHRNEINAYRHLYASQLNVAPRAWERNDIRHLNEILQKQKPEYTGNIDLRGFEWYYWKRLCHTELLSLAPGPALPCAALSPDGQVIATPGSAKGSVDIRDAADGRLRATLKGCRGGIAWVGFGPDSKRVYGASIHSTPPRIQRVDISGWDWTTREHFMNVDAPDGSSSHFAVSPDGARIAAATRDTSKATIAAVHVFNARTGEFLFALNNPGIFVPGIWWSADGERLITLALGQMNIWSAPPGTQGTIAAPTSSYPFPNGGTHSALSPKNNFLATTSLNNPTVYLFDLRNLAKTGLTKPLAVLNGHKGHVRTLAFSRDEQRLVTGGSDASIRIWKVPTGEEIGNRKGHGSNINFVAFTPDGDRVVSAGGDGLIKAWSVHNQPQVLRIPLKSAAALVSFGIHPQSQQLAMAATYLHAPHLYRIDPSGVHVHSLADGKAIQSLKRDGISAVAYNADGSGLVLVGMREDKTDAGVLLEVTEWSFLSGESRQATHRLPRRPTAMCFSQDARLFAWAAWDGNVAIWDVERQQVSKVLDGQSAGRGIYCLAFDRTATRLVLGGGDQGIRIFDINTTSRLVAYTRTHAVQVSTLAFSPDGRHVASGGADNLVKIWDAAAPGANTPLLTLHGHTYGVRFVAFSPDGKRLASVGPETKVWNADEGNELLNLDEPGSILAFSPSGEHLAIADKDRGVAVVHAPRR